MLRDSLLENGVDSLTINLSYGINNRINDFLSCDIEHEHKQSDSQDEINLFILILQESKTLVIFFNIFFGTLIKIFSNLS